MRLDSASSLSLALCLPITAYPKGGHGGSSHASHSHVTHSRSHTYVARDLRGPIKRDAAARAAFQKRNPCTAAGKTSGAWPGYVIDYVTSPKRGGADSPSNMQWQTKPAAKEEIARRDRGSAQEAESCR